MLEVIRQRAKAYRKETFHPGGRITVRSKPPQLFQSAELQQLSFQELQELCYIFTQMSHNQGMNVIMLNEHIELWSRIDSLLYSARATVNYWIFEHNPLATYVKLDFLQHLFLLPECIPEGYSSDNSTYQDEVLEKRIGLSSFPAVWTGFAYLEGLCRRICKKYVAEDGTVIKAFKVKGDQYRSKKGNKRAKRGRGGKLKISNLNHLLELTRREVSAPTRGVLKKFFRLHSTKEIFGWRNACLHGEEDKQSTVIVLYSLISILLLDVVQKAPHIPDLGFMEGYKSMNPHRERLHFKDQTYEEVLEGFDADGLTEAELLKLGQDFLRLQKAPEVVAIKRHFSQLNIFDTFYLKKLRCYSFTDAGQNLTTEGAVTFLSILLESRKAGENRDTGD